MLRSLSPAFCTNAPTTDAANVDRPAITAIAKALNLAVPTKLDWKTATEKEQQAIRDFVAPVLAAWNRECEAFQEVVRWVIDDIEELYFLEEEDRARDIALGAGGGEGPR